MNQFCKSVLFFLFIFITVNTQNLSAQTKADIFNTSNSVTWLGLDFSSAKILGTASQFGKAGEITNELMRDKYIPSWNQLFINEMKKYDVASAVHRSEVKYELGVTSEVNKNLKSDFFTVNPDDLNSLDSKKINELVRKYDFNNLDGIGLIFFVEGMNKDKAEVACWITFVNMKTKAVLLIEKGTGKVGGFGFRNFWAKGFFNILTAIKSNFNYWKK